MTDDQAEQANRLGDDLLVGAAEIADFLKKTKRQVHHLAQTQALPIGRLNKNLIASKSELTRAFRKLTAG